MRPGPICKVIGILLMFFSLTMLSPIIVSLIFEDHNAMPFFYSFLVTLISGLTLWILAVRSTQQLTTKDGFIIVIMVWVVLALYGAVPYWFSNGLDISFTKAVFESVSGFTATGSTVITGLEHLPKSLLYYRQQTQLFGGMGIIILSVAILPMLGVGGMQLYRAEANGPWKENKLTPHIAETAKVLWQIYVFFALACILCYWLAGMDLFDAILYAFSTVATGGFAPTDASMATQSQLILFICMIFMVLSATAFKLHFIARHKRTLSVYWQDPEFRSFIYIMFFMSVLVILTLLAQGVEKQGINAFWDGMFQVVSFASNTGFVSSETFYLWPLFLPILLMFIALVGGCAGSTASGLKVVRAVLLRKQAFREARRLVHPQGMFVVKFGDKVMSETVLNSVWGFVAAYFMLLGVIWLAVMAFGIDSHSAFSIACASLSNVGPALGVAGNNFSTLPDGVLWVCDFAMLVGRLELFTVIVLFTPDFWRR